MRRYWRRLSRDERYTWYFVFWMTAWTSATPWPVSTVPGTWAFAVCMWTLCVFFLVGFASFVIGTFTLALREHYLQVIERPDRTEIEKRSQIDECHQTINRLERELGIG